MEITPEILWALRTTSPKWARKAKSLPILPEANLPSSADDPPGMDGSIGWQHGSGATSSMMRVNFDCVVKNVVYCAIRVDDASPSVVRNAVLQLGLHLRAAMTQDGLWRAAKRPMDEFVVAAVISEEVRSNDGVYYKNKDQAMYQLGEELFDQGKIEYQRALADLDQAVRDGWPGWEARGIQVLE